MKLFIISVKWIPIELLTVDDYNKPAIACFGKDDFDFGKFVNDSEYGKCFDAGEHYWNLDIITHYSLLNNPK